VVKISLRGKCNNIRLNPTNGEPARCEVCIELDHNVPLTYHLYDIRLYVPTEFANLLEIGLPIIVTLEQEAS
jgi:hypothetical protein